ncbi:winged helix-turn-helix transcriptional regulator [Kitasatospora aburaviensis]
MAVKTLADAAPDERFAELRRRMPGVSQKMLSVTLRSLTRDGLVSRRVEPTVPPRVFYRLTGLGLSLEAALAGSGPGRRSTWPRSTAPMKPPTRRSMRDRPASVRVDPPKDAHT